MYFWLSFHPFESTIHYQAIRCKADTWDSRGSFFLVQGFILTFESVVAPLLSSVVPLFCFACTFLLKCSGSFITVWYVLINLERHDSVILVGLVHFKHWIYLHLTACFRFLLVGDKVSCWHSLDFNHVTTLRVDQSILTGENNGVTNPSWLFEDDTGEILIVLSATGYDITL